MVYNYYIMYTLSSPNESLKFVFQCKSSTEAKTIARLFHKKYDKVKKVELFNVEPKNDVWPILTVVY